MNGCSNQCTSTRRMAASNGAFSASHHSKHTLPGPSWPAMGAGAALNLRDTSWAQSAAQKPHAWRQKDASPRCICATGDCAKCGGGALAPRMPEHREPLRHGRDPLKNAGLTGGCEFRRRPQFIFANHLCCLTSEAPLLLPRRVASFLSKRRVTMSLHDL